MTPSQQRIVVTGGAGFIGSHVVDALLARGNTVRVIDDFSVGRNENLAEAERNDRCEIIKADVCDRGRMRELTHGFDAIFHMAIQCLRVSINDPWSNHHVNATGTLSMLDAAKQNSVGMFIYVSSSEVYGTAQSVPMTEDHPKEPITVYGASKLAGELYALAYHRTYGLPVTVVRPFNAYGPREHYLGKSAEVIPRFFMQILHGTPITLYGDGAQTRDFTYVDDTVHGIVAASESKELLGGVVNIALGQEISILAIAKKLAAILKKDLKIQRLPDRPGDVRQHYADISKAEKLLGYAPTVSIDDGLQRYVDWCFASSIDWKEAHAFLEPTNW